MKRRSFLLRISSACLGGLFPGLFAGDSLSELGGISNPEDVVVDTESGPVEQLFPASSILVDYAYDGVQDEPGDFKAIKDGAMGFVVVPATPARNGKLAVSWKCVYTASVPEKYSDLYKHPG